MAPWGKKFKMTAKDREKIFGPDGKRRKTADGEKLMTFDEAVEIQTERYRQRLEALREKDRKRKARDARAARAQKRAAAREAFQRLAKSIGGEGVAVSKITDVSQGAVGGPKEEGTNTSKVTAALSQTADPKADGGARIGKECASDREASPPLGIPKKRKLTEEIVESLLEQVIGVGPDRAPSAKKASSLASKEKQQTKEHGEGQVSDQICNEGAWTKEAIQKEGSGGAIEEEPQRNRVHVSEQLLDTLGIKNHCIA